jgi:hypothetical protein
MAITVQATYEDGVLKPAQPLPLQEHEQVRITIESLAGPAPADAVIPCSDPALIKWAALSPELEYPPGADEEAS